MAGQLTKDTKITYLPGSPAVAGLPGTPGRPAYCEMVQPAPYPKYFPVDVFVPYQPARTVGAIVFPEIPAHIVYAYRTELVIPPAVQVCYPATVGTPPKPGTPGSPSQTLADYRLGWNAGAISDAAFPSDCALTLNVTASSVGVVAGLNGSNAGADYAEIDHALYFSHGRALVYEGGVQKGFVRGFASADSFEIRRVGALVTYHHNGALFYTSDAASTGNVFADSSFYAGGDRIASAAFAALPSASGTGTASAGTSYGAFLPLTGDAANKLYAASAGYFLPLAGTTGADELTPTYAVSAGALAYLLGAGRMLTGEQASSAASFLPLGALGANRPYASATGKFAPLSTFIASFVTPEAYALVAAPMGSLRATVRSSAGENAANVIAPVPTLRAYTGAFARLAAPHPTLSASATGTGWIQAKIIAPAGKLSAAATVSGTSQAAIAAPMAALVGYAGMICSITLTGRATVQAVVTSGGIASAVISAPMATLDVFEVRAEAYCTARIMAPAGHMAATLQAWIMAPAGKLTAVGTAIVAATYEAYSINLAHAPRGRGAPEPVDEVTRYTNFPFTHVVRYQGSYFGAAADGLYLLEGTTDDGAAIDYAVKTCTDDFGVAEKKTVASACFGGRLGPEATITLAAGETGAESYAFTTPRGQAAQNHREKFGRGVKNRYFAVGVAGNGALELDTLDLDITKLTRRI